MSEIVAGRYRVLEELGRGGMATVYRVLDGASGREVALKRLDPPEDQGKRSAAEALFETEFRTLAELHHPRVIQVYDYGVVGARAYYTMELLDGGDLSQQSPMPWRDACRLIYDVCSSLALLHSRRLVHRDVSPRNIHRSRDGRPRLIDFGAMASMGPCTQAVGTPAFVAPEVAQRASLDGRTDLFSLGGTLYFALTGRPPFPARNFAQLHEVWSVKPLPPSAYKQDIPPALDGLTLSMISLEPALRPRSAFDVMQKLAAIAQIEETESLGVSRAYLATPTLVGRDDVLARLGRRCKRAQSGVGSSLLLEGPPGSGRSRALDACVLQLKTSGVVTLRAGGKLSGRRNFALTQVLAEQLLGALPEASVAAARAECVTDTLFQHRADGAFDVLPLKAPASERATLLDAIGRWFTRVARTQTLAVIVDDVDCSDDASAAFLALLAERCRRHRLLVIASAEPSVGQLALQVLRERSKLQPLLPLTAEGTEALFDSVFGDVPHVALIADRIHQVSRGNPRMSMELAQHLVNQGVIVYDAGTWTLPPELERAALPSTLEAAFEERVARLSPSARALAQCHALSSYRELTRSDHAQLAAAQGAADLSRALAELVEAEVLASDGQVWKLAQNAYVTILARDLDEATLRARHAALAALGEQTDKPALTVVHHLLSAGRAAHALDRLEQVFALPLDALEATMRAYVSPRAVCELLERALEAAESAGRPLRLRSELRRWICLVGVAIDEEFYYRVSPQLLAQLRHDTGLDDWDALEATSDRGQRLMAALSAASQRYGAAAPEARAYPPDEAIRHLVMFVAVSIAVGARTFNLPLVRSLPRLLEPLATLSPVIDAIHENAIATCEAAHAQYIQARERWLSVMERLSKVEGDALRYVDAIRYAIAFALGCLEAGRGIPTAEHWAQLLDNDPMQKVAGMYLRKVGRLQLGDWEGAERYRRMAELLALQASSQQLLSGSQLVELSAHAMASDLPGVRQCAARIEALAQRHAGWRPHAHLARGYFDLLRGDPAAAVESLERALGSCTPDEHDETRSISAWPGAAGAYLQALMQLGRDEEARSYGLQTLAQGERLGVRTLEDVVRGLALAETKLGDYSGACTRLQALIDRQLGLGITGLHLGATYEARARIAILAGDRAAVETYGRMTAEQYRHGRNSPLGTRYEALMAEARRAGVQVLPALSNFEHTIGLTELRGIPSSTFALVTSALRTIPDREQRCLRSLRVICNAYTAQAGYLYVVQDGALEFAASLDDTQPGAAPLALATRCLTQALQEDDLATAMVDTTGSSAAMAAVWTEQGTVEHRSLLISGLVEGTLRHAGVVVLVSPASHGGADALATLRAVGELLLELGDSAGIAAPS